MRASIWIEAEELREFERTGTDAHRLCTYNDGWVECFAADALVSYKNEVARDRLTTELALWALGCNFKLGRIFGRYLPKQNAERDAPVLLLAIADKSAKRDLRTLAAIRNRFRRRLFRRVLHRSAGNRQYVRRVAPKKLLNCFAYTCSFSVAAANCGATTVNIDLSKKSLARGRENFALNSLTTNDHHFLPMMYSRSCLACNGAARSLTSSY